MSNYMPLTEEINDYIIDLVSNKLSTKISYYAIADIVKEKFGFNKSECWYRNHYSHLVNDESMDKLLAIKKEKVKLADERTQNNAYVRQLAREETIRDIAMEAVAEVSKIKLFPTSATVVSNFNTSMFDERQAILEVSDWHYGIDTSNYWNTYNPEIAKERVHKLAVETLRRCVENNVRTLHLVNLGDLIAGRIHLTLRLESRFDVITQTLQVAEILAEFIHFLIRGGIKIEYYDCIDNHSRLEPNKKDAMDLESLQRIIPWYLEERFKDFKDDFTHHENVFGNDIISFNCMGYNIIGVHGDKDAPQTLVDKLSTMTGNHYDLICTAHLHHFSADEKNNTLVVANSSLMGTDTYAKNLRLNSKPSQNLIIVSEDSVCDTLYRILV